MLSTLFLTLTIGAPLVKDKPMAKLTLVGEWQVESVDVGGGGIKKPGTSWVFNADGTAKIGTVGAVVTTLDYKADMAAKPMSVDLTEHGPGQGVNLSVYRIEGDTLTLSVGHRSIRPTDLSPSPNATVWVMKRVKSKN